MRTSFALLVAAALVIAVAARWTSLNFAVSIVPGWHTPILSPHAVGAILVAVVLLAIALVIALKQLGGDKASR